MSFELTRGEGLLKNVLCVTQANSDAAVVDESLAQADIGSIGLDTLGRDTLGSMAKNNPV